MCTLVLMLNLFIFPWYLFNRKVNLRNWLPPQWIYCEKEQGKFTHRILYVPNIKNNNNENIKYNLIENDE